MIRQTQLESTKSDTSAFLTPSKRVEEGYFAGLFQEARMDAAQQLPSNVERHTPRDRQDPIRSKPLVSDEAVSDRDLSEVPADDDCVPAESLPADSSENDAYETDQDVQENTTDSDEANSDENPQSSEQDTTNVAPSQGESAAAPTPNSQQELLSGLVMQANAKTTQQQLANQQTQPPVNPQLAGSSAEQADVPPVLNQQPDKINLQATQQQVNPVLPKQPEQNTPSPQTTMPADTVELNVESPKVIEVQPQSEFQVTEEVAIKPEGEKLIQQTVSEVVEPAETKKQVELSVLNTKEPVSESNDNVNRSRQEIMSRQSQDESIEVVMADSDTSKKRGSEFTKQNQGQPNMAVMAKTKASVSGEPQVDLQNLPEIKSSGSAQSTDTVDRQENVDRIVRAARTAQARGSSRIQIRLEPPELGTLRIDIKQSSDGLTLQLQATSPKAQQLLQQSSNELRSALEAQGLQPRQIDIQLRLDLRNDSTANQQQNENPFSQPGSQGQSHNPGHEDFQSEPFPFWQDGQAEQEQEPEPVEWQSTPAAQWQSLDFNGLDVRA